MSKFDRNRIKDGWEKLCTNKQTDKPTDTTEIMVTWPWTNTARLQCDHVLFNTQVSSLAINMSRVRLPEVTLSSDDPQSPFTRYKGLPNRLNNRLNICIHDTAGCPTDPLSARTTIWYRPKGGDALWREGNCGPDGFTTASHDRSVQDRDHFNFKVTDQGQEVT